MRLLRGVWVVTSKHRSRVHDWFVPGPLLLHIATSKPQTRFSKVTANTLHPRLGGEGADYTSILIDHYSAYSGLPAIVDE
jgi:hypothetical protein